MAVPSSRARTIGIVGLIAGLVGALACTMLFPPVEGLGTKVRLPIFHGALTWVNLAAFSIMGLLALAFLIFRKPALAAWEEALRRIAVPLWLIGSVLGLLSAMRTWDFTGSKASPLLVVMDDPRLTAQFWIVIAGLILLAAELVLDDPRWRAAGDVAFVALLWSVLMRAILGPGRALHPDSPVMNSEEIMIKALFFGIVISLTVAVTAATYLVVLWSRSREAMTPVDLPA